MNIPHIRNAFSNIKNACEKKLPLLYPAGVPDAIQARYELELSFLQDSELLDDFEIFRCLSMEAQKSSNLIHTRGTVTGSFIYYLLGNNCFNPLPVHYYCPECGYYEEIKTPLFGIDLPEKECPHCKKSILAEGFNLSSESVWGCDGKKRNSLEHFVNTDFYPFARRCLISLYPNNAIVPWGIFCMAEQTSSQPNANVRILFKGYAILPSNSTIHDYPDMLSYLENGDLCITGGGYHLKEASIKPVYLSDDLRLNQVLSLQRATGVYANDIKTHELREITWNNLRNTTVFEKEMTLHYAEQKPKTYRDLVAAMASSHNTYSWSEPDKFPFYSLFDQMTSSDVFMKYPCFTRDDFFDHMVNIGIERKLAFDASERISYGHATSSKYKEEFNSLPIPEEIKEIAKNYRYVFPRSHCVEFLLLYARLAYYAKVDSRAFSKIVFKKK